MSIVVFALLAGIVACGSSRVDIVPVYGDKSYCQTKHAMINHDDTFSIPDLSRLPSFGSELRLNWACCRKESWEPTAASAQQQETVLSSVVEDFTEPMTALRDEIFATVFLSEQPSPKHIPALLKKGNKVAKAMRDRLDVLQPGLSIDDMVFVPKFLLPEVHIRIRQSIPTGDQERVEANYWMYMKGPRLTTSGLLSYFRFAQDMRTFIASEDH